MEFNYKIHSLGKLSSVDGEIHLVYITSGGDVTKKECEKFFNVSKDIIKQKMHFHLYIGLTIEQNEKYIKEFLDDIKDFPNVKYFHLHKSLNSIDIIKELSVYDFGLWLLFPDEDGDSKTLETELASGNKLASFLEAGIPFFYDERMKFVGKITKEYEVGLPISLKGENSINNLSKRIKKKYLNIK